MQNQHQNSDPDLDRNSNPELNPVLNPNYDLITVKLRKNLLERRQALPQSEQEHAASAACQRLLALGILQEQQHIAVYQPVKGEISAMALTSLLPSAYFYLPILHPAGLPQLWFGQLTATTQLVTNRYHINEPDWRTSPLCMPWELDIVIVPLVAFDEYANRLGMGAGFYDRTFAFRQQSRRRKPCLIGLAYEWQRQPLMKPEKWDVAMDYIVTDQSHLVKA